MKPGQLRFPLRIPFVEELGLELWAFGRGHAELRMNLAESHFNSWAVAHGGVVMTMLDVAMAHAARSDSVASKDTARSHGKEDTAALDHGPGVVTVEMKTTFMRPAEGKLRAVGKLQHRTATMAFTEGSLFNAADELCAHATGTFKFVRALPTTGRKAKILQRAQPDTANQDPS